MSEYAITANGLSKSYKVGEVLGARYDTFREAVGRKFRGSWRRRPQLEARNDVIWALRDLDLAVPHGAAMGLIGRNGAGKSTLLKVLSRVTPPTSGRAEIFGRVGTLLEVGAGFHPELTGRENAFLNGAILGMRKAEIKKKFDEIVAFSGVERHIDTPVKFYSSGMYLRLAFAVAAHLDTEVLLVDEVLAVGDAEFQRRCLRKMGEVSGQGRTVIFVSHNLGAVENLCDTAVWLDNGRATMVGSSSETIEAYMASLFAGEQREVGTGPVKITRVVLKNGAGKATPVFSPGDDIGITVHYSAARRYPQPYFALSVSSRAGPVCSANMLLDGRRPAAIEGEGSISCRFERLPLLPQAYAVHLMIRDQDARQVLFPAQEVAAFHVTGAMSDYGLVGDKADLKAGGSVPLVMPYRWEFEDGRVESVRLEARDV